jgi:hypothetical protein
MVRMNSAAFTAIGLVVILLAAMALYRKARGKRSRRFRLARQLSALRLRRMLGRRDIDIAQYLRLESPRRIERAIRACLACTRREECEAALADSRHEDFSFCPNNGAWLGHRRRPAGVR